MPRRLRCADGGYVYHVLNRAVGRATLFHKPADYAAFEKVLRQAWERSAMRVLAYVILPNHWHLVVWPERDGELTTYFAVVDRDACPPLARAPPHGGDGAAVPGPLQIVPDSGGRALFDGLPLRRAEPAACQPGEAGGGVALLEPVAPHP